MSEQEESKESDYSPYCRICESCGDDGCCSAFSCKHHPDGEYCQGYLEDLRFGYLMHKDLYNLIAEDENYKQRLEEIWEENYNIVYNKKEE